MVPMHVCNARVQVMRAGQGPMCPLPPTMRAHASKSPVVGDAATCDAHGASLHPHASVHALPKGPLHPCSIRATWNHALQISHHSRASM
eukprot:349963-Chlamydomonas_euryale.AAC.1